MLSLAALALLAAAGCSSTKTRTQSVPPPTVTVLAPHPTRSVTAACRPFMTALPAQLAGLSRDPVTPTSPLVAAWGSPAIVVRCGLAASLVKKISTAGIVAGVDHVRWYQSYAGTAVDWTTKRADVVVRIAIPGHYTVQAAYVVAVTKALKHSLD